MFLASKLNDPKNRVAITGFKQPRLFHVRRPFCRGGSLVVAAAFSATPALGTIYYVSPNGSDSNNGTSPATPWGSVTKVDDSYFKPGDQILFQYGSTWDASLDATSSGTSSSPIVYGAYGNPALGNPVFSGGNTVSNSTFTRVSGSTYQTTSVTPVNCVYMNGAFLTESQDLLTQQGSANANIPATNYSTVLSDPDIFYYNASNGQLFVNVGSLLTNQTIDLGTRQDAIYSNAQSNLLFRNLNTTETAADNQGYGVRIENSANITLLNSTVINAGKHSVGLIDATGVTVTNVVANGSQPQLGFGGASAFVSYADGNPAAGPVSLNDTSTYTNDSYINANGEYAIFISHGATNGIASVALNNLNGNNPDLTGISIQSTSANEVANVIGGIYSGAVGTDTNNSVINGATFVGNYGQAALGGNHSVVQNCVFEGSQTNYATGHNGALVDTGTNDSFRFNVVLTSSSGPGITVGNSTSNTSIYGNIIIDLANPSQSVGIGLLNFNNGSFNSNYNDYPSGTTFYPNQKATAAQWQSLGYDINSLFSIATFNNPGAGDYSLQNGSAGLGLVPASEIDSTLTTANSLLGSTASNGKYNAGLNQNVPTNLAVVSGNVVVSNPSAMTVIAPSAGSLTITSTSSFVSVSTASLDLSCNVILNSNGAFVSTGSLIVTGNFNNSGTIFISGSQLWSPGSVFTNLAGSAVFATDAGGSIAPVGYLTLNASGGSVVFASSQHLAGLNILPGGNVQVASQPTGSPSIVFTPSLTVTGVLDLTDNDMIVQSGNLAAVTAMIRQGYNNGKWNGTSGILSSTAAADTSHLTAIGVIQNTADGVNALYGYNGISLAAMGLFDGAIPNSTDVLVKFTYYGDANLNGEVDGTDYSLIDNGFLHHITGWFNGDFNYDSIVNGSDYTLIDNAFNQQGADLATSTADPSASVTTQIAGATAVPEPATAGILALGLLSVRCRRRRSGCV